MCLKYFCGNSTQIAGQGKIMSYPLRCVVVVANQCQPTQALISTQRTLNTFCFDIVLQAWIQTRSLQRT